MALESLSEKIKAVEELQDQISECIEDDLIQEFSEILALDKRVEAVGWVQYAPYFNDGDPCIFNVHGPCLRLGGGAPLWADCQVHSDDQEYDDYQEDGDWIELQYHSSPRVKELNPEVIERLTTVVGIISNDSIRTVLEDMGEGRYYLLRGSDELICDEYSHD